MRSTQFIHGRRQRRAGAMLRFQSLALASSLAFAPIGFAAERHNHQESAGQASTQKVVYREGGSILHDRMMEEIKRQQDFIGTKGGYSNGANSHMMQQGVLLVAEDPDKVAVTDGSRCPANVPVKEYHVSAINIEITLSRF